MKGKIMEFSEKKLSFFKNQWSFAIGGAVVGLGEVIYFLKFKAFIPVTNGLAQMFSTVEANITGTNTISQLYSPDIHWIIIGALLGAWFVGRMEKESRNWVKYSPGMLLLAFIGGIIFGFGTRLGPGCTTHHIFGGLAVMSIASWTIAIIGLPFAFLAFEFVAKLGYGPYFKHQENIRTCKMSRNAGMVNDHQLVLDDAYNPWKNPLRLIVWSLVALFIISSLYTGFFGKAEQSLGSGPLWPNVLRLAAGAFLGIGIAKAGVGTECGLMAPESLLVSEKHYQKLKIPVVTQRMFRALLPVSGVIAAVLMLNIAVLIMWLGFDWAVPNAAPKPKGWGLHIGHLLAAPCLAIGSVFMIGCEIRSYGRMGLGYLTGIVGLIGFYFGYLPYIYFHKAIDGFIANHTFTHSTNIPELFASTTSAQKFVGILYTLALIVLFAVIVIKGSKRVCATPKEYLLNNTDDLVFAVDNKINKILNKDIVFSDMNETMEEDKEEKKYA
jgi:hypothetical protein